MIKKTICTNNTWHTTLSYKNYSLQSTTCSNPPARYHTINVLLRNIHEPNIRHHLCFPPFFHPAHFPLKTSCHQNNNIFIIHCMSYKYYNPKKIPKTFTRQLDRISHPTSVDNVLKGSLI